jgi:beta-galactosidase
MTSHLLRCFLALWCVVFCGASPAAEPQARMRESFNAGWRFNFGDPAGAQAPGFDDAGWERVGLPHSFSIPYFQSPAFPVGPGWYRKALEVAEHGMLGQTFLEFEGAFQDAEIYVNGVKLARHRGGYTGFPVNITPLT